MKFIQGNAHWANQHEKSAQPHLQSGNYKLYHNAILQHTYQGKLLTERLTVTIQVVVRMYGTGTLL
jgi:hypothetical protein